MKRILFVINQFYKGGAETSLLNLLKKLDKSKYDIDLMVINQCPVENAVSLVDQLPPEVHLIDALKQQHAMSVSQKFRSKYLLTDEEKRMDPDAALLYAREKDYDWAFHVGEWWSPQFTANRVKAKHKCLWIHNDLSEAEYFQAEHFFSYDSAFDYYIFVSRNSLESSIKKYPFIKDKSICIYNINDTEQIKEKAKEEVKEDYFNRGLPVVLTCANIRAQKNHARQLKVMDILSKRGVEFIWLNLGATTEEERCERLKSQAQQMGLENRFIIAGSRENPYQYMRKADIVAVLSDYESWSMVITEAKILQKPIISTKTSGALEQIQDQINGTLTDFDMNDIADKLQKLIKDKKLRERFEKNLQNTDNTQMVLRDFDALINGVHEKNSSNQNNILYIIDDINYVGGAHIATKLQIRELLKQGISVSVFSSNTPSVQVRSELNGVRFISWKDFAEDIIYHRRLLDCLLDPSLTQEQKRYKATLVFEEKVKKKTNLYEEMVLPHISKLFSQFKTVCVMSEGSSFRKAVAESTCARKVQWIHIDYSEWRNQTEWNRKITANDGELYMKYDRIVVLSDGIKRKFICLYPYLEDKVIVNSNLIPVEEIRAKAEPEIKKRKILHFVTVGRVDYQKAYDRLLNILEKLYDKGYRFEWKIIGGGDDFDRINQRLMNSRVKACVEMLGSLSNPFPFVKEADVFALLSNFEGRPNTIYEAFVLGTPVIATDVGCVSEMVIPGENGWLVDNDDKAILKMLEHIMDEPNEVERIKEKISNYEYDNETVMKTTYEVFFGD